MVIQDRTVWIKVWLVWAVEWKWRGVVFSHTGETRGLYWFQLWLVGFGELPSDYFLWVTANGKTTNNLSDANCLICHDRRVDTRPHNLIGQQPGQFFQARWAWASGQSARHLARMRRPWGRPGRGVLLHFKCCLFEQVHVNEVMFRAHGTFVYCSGIAGFSAAALRALCFISSRWRADRWG